MITAEELETLAKLKEEGVITEKEFNDKRNELLSADSSSLIDKNQKVHNVLPVVILILSIIAAYLIFIGGNRIGEIRSVGGRTMEESYYQYLGLVYKGWSLFVLITGIFFSVMIKRTYK